MAPSNAINPMYDAINFDAPPLRGAASVTSTINLNVVDGQQTASASTASTWAPPVPIPAPQPIIVGTPPQGGNFTIADETTGTQSFASGSTHTCPAQGIDDQFIFVSPDNLNITSTAPPAPTS